MESDRPGAVGAVITPPWNTVRHVEYGVVGIGDGFTDYTVWPDWRNEICRPPGNTGYPKLVNETVEKNIA